MKKILSIDGGGIKGIIPAYQLVKLEEELGGKISDHFDLIAGTSTGAILAAGLSSGYNAQELLDLYLNEGKNIFKSSLKQKLKSMNGLIGSKYADKKFEKSLRKYFGNSCLKDLSTDFLAVTYNMTNDRPRFFSTSQEPEYDVANVVRASSAAPTYFNPVEIEGQKYIDGGVVSNNPAMCAYAEAKNLYKTQASEMFVLSLGTGTKVDNYNGMHKWFKFKWVNPLIELMMGADSGVVHYQLSQIYNSIDKRNNYYRISDTLPKGLDHSMDKVTDKHLNDLLAVAESIYIKNKNRLSLIAKIIS
jgi:uncharacterized protein